jgi:hypothetical protein
MKGLMMIIFKYLVDNDTLFDFLFHRFVMRRVHFTYSRFAWGLHGDVGLRWSVGLLVLELHCRDCG